MGAPAVAPSHTPLKRDRMRRFARFNGDFTLSGLRDVEHPMAKTPGYGLRWPQHPTRLSNALWVGDPL